MAKKSGRGTKPEWQKALAKERIKRLFEMADKSFRKDPDRSHRYVQLARKIGMRYNVRIPREMRTMFCKKCYKYLKANINSRVRTRSTQGAVVVTCLECGHVMRYPYGKEKRRKK